MVFTWVVFAWANVNLVVQAEVEGKSSSQLKNVEKSKNDYELELIEKGYIFFPPREINKSQTNSTKTINSNVKESPEKTAEKKGVELINSEEMKLNNKNKENTKPTVSELEKANDQELKRVEAYKNELITIIEKNKIDEKTRIKIVPTESEFKYGKHTLRSLLNEASEYNKKKENEKLKKYEIKIDPIEDKLNLPDLGGKEQSSDNLKKFEEIKNNITSKSKEIKINEEQKLLIGQNNSNYSYADYSGNTIFNIGIQNSGQLKSTGLNKPSFIASGATQLRKEIAIGFNYKYFDKKNDLTISAVNNIPDTNIYAKVAVGIMDGKETYNFFSGPSPVHLQQYNSLASLNYRNPDKFSNFKGIGINIWKIIAKQKSRFAPNYISKETDTSYDTYIDPRELAVGNVTGYSGTVRLKLNNSITTEQSFGKENLVYPLSDGTIESYKKNYLKSLLRYQIDSDSRFEFSYATGSVENKTRIEYVNSGFGMSLEKSRGLNGLKDYWYVGVTYSISDFLNPKLASKYMQNFDANDYLDHINLLRDVSQKPVEFPSNFLAKIDPTSVKLISSVTKPHITWSSNGLLGAYFDSKVPNRTSISIQLSAFNASNALVKYQTTLVSGALPKGLTLDENGLISGTAESETVDTTYTFKVKAISEGAVDKISPDLSITINAPTKGVISWISNGILGTYNDSIKPNRNNISIQLNAINSSLATVKYRAGLVDGNLPTGLTLDENGLISGTATPVLSDTTYTFRVKAVSAGAEDTISPELSIAIKAPTYISWSSNGNIAMLNDSVSPSRSNVSIQLFAYTNSPNPLIYETTLASGSLPPGLSLNANGLITGTASQVAQDTTYTFKVNVHTSDVANVKSEDLSITVLKPQPTIIWGSGEFLGIFNDSILPNRKNISIQLIASNSSNAAVKYQTTLIEGALPSGLSLNENGLISGTADPVLVDTYYNFKIKVTSAGAQDKISPNLFIVIKAPLTIKWISSGSLTTLNDSSRSNVSIQLQANSNSSNPLVYETKLASGSLPPGLLLNSNGLISGTANQVTQDTTFKFTVNVHTADVANVQSQELSITILKLSTDFAWVDNSRLLNTENCSRTSIAIDINLFKNKLNDGTTYSVNSGNLPSDLQVTKDGRLYGNIVGVESDSMFTFTAVATRPDGTKIISPSFTISKIVNNYFYNPQNDIYYRPIFNSGSYGDYINMLRSLNNSSNQCIFYSNKTSEYQFMGANVATVISNDILNFINNKVFSNQSKPSIVYIGGTSGINGVAGLKGSANSISSEFYFGNYVSVDLHKDGIVQNNLIPSLASNVILDSSFYSDGYLTLDLSAGNPIIVPKKRINQFNNSVIFLYQYGKFKSPLF
jgi:hypothetical protein